MSRIKNFDQFVQEGLNFDQSIENASSLPRIKEILSKLSSIPIFDRVKKCYSPTPEYFVENLKKEFPEIGPKSSELLVKMKSVLKMKKPEMLQYLSKNWKKMISGDLSESEILSEALPPGMPGLIAFGVAIILLIIYSATMPDPVATPEPAPAQVEPSVKSPETLELMKLFSGKTINLYNDPEQRYLYGKLKIDIIRWYAEEIEGGIQRVEMTCVSNYLGRDIKHRYIIKGLLNPPSISKAILDDDRSIFYNGSFTDELNRIATPWIKKPDADYSKKRTK
jgi:hypothetical protein